MPYPTKTNKSKKKSQKAEPTTSTKSIGPSPFGNLRVPKTLQPHLPTSQPRTYLFIDQMIMSHPYQQLQWLKRLAEAVKQPRLWPMEKTMLKMILKSATTLAEAYPGMASMANTLCNLLLQVCRICGI